MCGKRAFPVHVVSACFLREEVIMNHQWRILMFALLLLAGLVLWGCSEEDKTAPTAPQEVRADCIGCHTSETSLRATALPDTQNANQDPGEG